MTFAIKGWGGGRDQNNSSEFQIVGQKVAQNAMNEQKIQAWTTLVNLESRM